jgi:hypothetical protein
VLYSSFCSVTSLFSPSFSTSVLCVFCAFSSSFSASLFPSLSSSFGDGGGGG